VRLKVGGVVICGDFSHFPLPYIQGFVCHLNSQKRLESVAAPRTLAAKSTLKVHKAG